MKKYSLQLGNIFESNQGYGTMYPEIFPTDWVKSSGIEEDGYYKTVPTMLTKVS